MSWRTVVIRNRAKLSYKGGNMIVRGENLSMIHLGEIHTLMIDTLDVSITSYLISELIKAKVKIVFCDEKHNPESEVHGLHANHISSLRIKEQMNWKDEIKKEVWTKVLRQKISNQRDLLKMEKKKEESKLDLYLEQLEIGDVTNREGLAAKVFFEHYYNEFYGRENDDSLNIALNYGYTILLSAFNKEIVSLGLLTQIGIQHHNEFNHYNLSCDLMEPFRCVVEKYVKENEGREFNQEYKLDLINILNHKIYINQEEQFVSHAINLYTHSVYKALTHGDSSLLTNVNV